MHYVRSDLRKYRSLQQKPEKGLSGHPEMPSTDIYDEVGTFVSCNRFRIGNNLIFPVFLWFFAGTARILKLLCCARTYVGVAL